MADSKDTELLQEYVKHQSESAFAELVNRQVNFVYSVALRAVGNSSDAQDVTQAVFVILARKAASVCHRTTLTGWLYETTRLTARQSLRTTARRIAREQEAYMQSTLDQPGDELWRHLEPHLDSAMAHLRPADRELLALRFYENKTGEESAALLGIGAAAAHKRTQRALAKLQQFLAARGVTSTADAIAAAVSANFIMVAPAGLSTTATTAALAKGATASASCLTLTKGALKIMAWTKAKMAVAIVAGGLLATGTATIVAVAVRPIPEPVYQGRSLTEWLVDLDGGDFQKTPKQLSAEDALRHIGKSALPFLLNDLADSKHQPHNLRLSRPDNRTADERLRQSVRGFEALGPLAKPAIQDLVSLLPENPGYVPAALVAIGRDALPPVKQALTNSNFFVRDNTAANLANAVSAHKIAPADVADVIPLAAANISYANSNTLYECNTRHRAAGLLGSICLSPEISVPALSGGLTDTYPSVASECAQALGGFGVDAQSATPALLKAIASTNADLSATAAWSLSRIEPAALAQHALAETVALTTNADIGARMKALWALREVGPRGGDAVAPLLVTLTDSDNVIRMLAAQALGAIAQHPEESVPALIRALQDPSPIVRSQSASALGEFGGRARSAVIPLLAAAKTDPSLIGNARDALENIDPKAAAALK